MDEAERLVACARGGHALERAEPVVVEGGEHGFEPARIFRVVRARIVVEAGRMGDKQRRHVVSPQDRSKSAAQASSAGFGSP